MDRVRSGENLNLSTIELNIKLNKNYNVELENLKKCRKKNLSHENVVEIISLKCLNCRFYDYFYLIMDLPIQIRSDFLQGHRSRSDPKNF